MRIEIDDTHLTAVDKIVRDHVYDETGPGKRSFITAKEVTNNVNAIRGVTTNSGAIRRNLQNVVDTGLVVKFPLGGDRTQAYKWRMGEDMPEDYVYRPIPPKVNTPPVSTTTDEQRKIDALNRHLTGRVTQIQQDTAVATKPYVYPQPPQNWPSQPPTPVSTPKPATTPKAKPANVKPKVILRPNGENYLPRELAGNPDVETLRKLRESNLYPLLYGPPGGGKTALLEAAFADTPGGFYVITGDENTKVDDFVGQFYPSGKGDEFYWADGPLAEAAVNGGVLFIDDATLIGPKEIACIYPLMDGRRELSVKNHPVEDENGKARPAVIKAKPGFFVVAAHNPGVQGAFLSDALASRFTVPIKVDSDMQLARSLGVPAAYVKLAENLRTRKANGDLGIFVPEMRDLLAAKKIAAVFGDYVAACNLLGRADEDFQDDLAVEMKTVFRFDRPVKPLELGGEL